MKQPPTLLDLIADGARRLSGARVCIGHLHDNALDEARSLVLHALDLPNDWPAHLARARLLVSALRIEPTNDLLAFRCWETGVPCAIHVVDLSLTEKLLELDVRYLMIPKIDGMKLQNRVLQEDGFLPG